MVAKNGPFVLTVGSSRNIFQYEESDQRKKYVKPFLKKTLHKNDKYTTDVMIYLTKQGFQIGKGIKKLLPQYMNIDTRSYQYMVWAQANYTHSPINGEYSQFIIKPVDPKDHSKGYTLFVSRGFQNSYLLTNKPNPIWSTSIICSKVEKHGHKNPDYNNWFFDKKN